MLNMHLDRVLRHPKVQGDRFIRMSELQLHHDLRFAACECCCATAAIVMLNAIRLLAVGLPPMTVSARMAEKATMDVTAGCSEWWTIGPSGKDEPQSGNDDID
jgi:hypothetical protein